MTFSVAEMLRRSMKKDVLVIGAGTGQDTRHVDQSLTEPKVSMV